MSDGQFKRIQLEQRDGVTIVHFKDARLLDDETIRNVGKELTTLVEQDEPKLILNFANVSYLASAMLGKFINLHRKVKQNNGFLGFCSIPAPTFEVFRISKLETYFQVYESLDRALAAVNS